MALGFDYYLHGRQTADVVARILKGEKPGDIPVEFANKLFLLFNTKVAKDLDLDLTKMKESLDQFVENMKSQKVEVTLKLIQ
ncbi:MAG: hypothetical protein NTX88_09200 [Candidatus Atribacteria bacterium]|nr:hypothetical protein [Candidatus Atribacteria bacterium]